MILPIVAFGDPVLRSKSKEIKEDYDNLDNLINDMWETMYNAKGVGLAAPQIGKSIRVFVVDASPFSEDEELELSERKKIIGFKKVFINPTIVRQSSKLCSFTEGCLSIPDVRENVKREDEIEINFFDQNFNQQILKIDGLRARVVQHEYDHIEGILFTDKISSFKRKIINNKLKNISTGKISVSYPMSFDN
tara:strand:- start:340 stop:915 length:576 start_codon:yes stop_codon:yes gene_type:complete